MLLYETKPFTSQSNHLERDESSERRVCSFLTTNSPMILPFHQTKIRLVLSLTVHAATLVTEVRTEARVSPSKLIRVLRCAYAFQILLGNTQAAYLSVDDVKSFSIDPVVLKSFFVL